MKPEYKRQCIHALGALIVPAIYYLGRLFTAIASVLLLLFFITLAFTKHSAFREYRRKHEFPFKGAIFFYLSTTISLIIFPDNVAAAAIGVLAVSDAISTIIGINYGRHKIVSNPSKSIEGMAGFFVSAFIILLFFVTPLKALIIAFLASDTELLPLNDNITIPFVVGFLMLVL